MISNSLSNNIGSVYLKDDYCIIANKFCIQAYAEDFFGFLERIFWEPHEFL